jgi:hypothetical protein
VNTIPALVCNAYTGYMAPINMALLRNESTREKP